MSAEVKTGGTGSWVEVPNPHFSLRKDGAETTKKTENFNDIANWKSSSLEQWMVGNEKGAFRRGNFVCYMNTNTWVEQDLTNHRTIGGAYYTVLVDACRSAERAEYVVVTAYVNGQQVHTERLGKLASQWRELRSTFQVPADAQPTDTLRIRLAMPRNWGQIDNVRLYCGTTPTALEDFERAQALAEQKRRDEAMATYEAGGAPLNSGWSIWEHRKPHNKMNADAAYLSGIARVADFKTVQGFWQYWNQLPLPSEFFTDEKNRRRTFEDRTVEGLSVFREGIEPTWEDPMNGDGGEWFIRSGGNALPVRKLDDFWEQLVLGAIGESLDPGSEICGIRVVDKSRGRGSGGPTYRLEVWFRRQHEGVQRDIQQRIQRCLQEVSGRGGPPNFTFRNHKF